MCRHRYRLLVLIFALLPGSLHAQTAGDNQCSVAQTINYPVDVDQFRLGQDFAVASPRHQGRYHTGEDWFLGMGASLGQPVRAIAAGRVTYSAPTGWGRDGGVIIIEHTFPDGSTVYSQYGHIAQTDTVLFPPRLSCVEAGQVIAVIGDARPAPHLHLEIRINQPDIPGPGYTRENPFDLGWRRPSQFIINRQAWLHMAYRWHVQNTTGNVNNPPPLVLNDNSMLLVDGSVLRRATSDGRVLWRVSLPGRAVSVTGYRANPYVTLADGTIARIDFEGAMVERWSLDFRPDSPPLVMGENLVYHTDDNALVALAADRRSIIWRVEGVPRFRRGYVAGALIALVTEDNRLVLVSTDGRLVSDSAALNSGASLASAPDGTLLAYTQGGLWRISGTGEWALTLENTPPGGGPGAVAALDDGRLFLLDGENIYAYGANGTAAWQARLPQAITGQTQLTRYGDGLLITSSHGHIMVVRATGGICGFTRIYGSDSASFWHSLGTDGVLRVAVGDQVIGLDWGRFAATCAG